MTDSDFTAARNRRHEIHTLAEHTQDTDNEVLTQLAHNIGELCSILDAIEDPDAHAAQVSELSIAFGPDVSEQWGLQLGLTRQELVESIQAARQRIMAHIDTAREQVLKIWTSCDRSADEIQALAAVWSHEHGRQAGEDLPNFRDTARDLIESAFDN